MSKILVIVESPKKAKVINKYLGSNYNVIASVGHLIDLPIKGQGVKIKQDFQPVYEIMDGKNDIYKNIVKLAKKADEVFFLTDPDREGEGMARNMLNFMEKDIGKFKYKRATTNTITKKAIEQAIKNAKDIDYAMVDSYETRRIVDRLVGYKCSYITQKATGGRSVGRTQSSTLRILSNREKEIKSFIPEEYWVIESDVITPRHDIIHVNLIKPNKMEINSEEKSQIVVDYLTDKQAECIKYEDKEQKQKPYPPFKTSTLQSTAASLFKWGSKKTMQVVQSLYESGHTSYIRTDSLVIEPDTLNSTRDYISHNLGEKYLPNSICYYSNKKGILEQGAHEAIRPTDINVKIAGETSDEKKLYELIWKRTIACQMNPAIYNKISTHFSCGEYVMSANGSHLIFDGFRKIWAYGGSEDKDIPKINIGEKCSIKNIDSTQKFTQPPPRYSESSIIKVLEDTGIGRPSTYATLIETLKNRKYVTINKSKSFEVTSLGLDVNDFLVNANFCFVDINFTKEMEERLDSIGNKKDNKLNVLTDFWDRLKSDIEHAKSIKIELSKTDISCPKCKNYMIKKFSKFGPFLVCSNKECKTICNIDKEGNVVEKQAPKASEYKCPLCKAIMYERNGKYGKFYGCSKFSINKCYGMRNSSGENVSKIKKKYKKKKK